MPNVSQERNAITSLAIEHADLWQGPFNPRKIKTVNRSSVDGIDRIYFKGTVHGTDPHAGSIAVYNAVGPAKEDDPTVGMRAHKSDFGILLRPLEGEEEIIQAIELAEPRGIDSSNAWAAELLVASLDQPGHLDSTGQAEVFIPFA